MTTSIERIVCLALAVIGPMTAYRSLQGERTRPRYRKSIRELLGRSVHSLFNAVEWGTLGAMTLVFTSAERCLQLIGIDFPDSTEDACAYTTGMQTVEGWNEETNQLANDIIHLSRALEATRKRCEELTKEVSSLRQKCNTYSEAGSILEQDREQLQCLLSDKCKLIKENQNLERRIRSLSELLQYAVEQAVPTEADNPPYFSWDDETSHEDSYYNETNTLVAISPTSRQSQCSPEFDFASI